mmetsp:Transcript_13115/g.23773  ORF Transcript_13115/g.23773 Transcript_13115/m.23773 type:complete len:89 (-) Transcript_13115:1729-1995(-)
MSNADVASSRITSRGRFTNTRPNANRCCSPRDNVLLQSRTAESPLMGSPLPALSANSLKSTASNTASKSSSENDWRSKWAPLNRCPSG